MRINFLLIVVLFFCQFSFAETATKPQPQHAEGIENFFKLNERIYSGSSPENENAFAALQKLGIKTLISVDGAKPDVETAKKFGLRYVHLPFGYDSVPTKQALKLVKAARELPKPIYVHCHHGMHRGPAGAAIICQGTENWSAQLSSDWLKQAGTATNYSGLYKSVAKFRPPSAEELKKFPNDFPATIETSPLVDAMVEIDGRHDNLKRLLKTNLRPASVRIDLHPAHEALLLEELFKELNRSDATRQRSLEFQLEMANAEKLVSELRRAIDSKSKSLSDADQTELSATLGKVTKSCASCHKGHRN